MSDNICPRKLSIRLDSEPGIRDAVEAMMNCNEAKSVSDALRILLRRGVSMTNTDSELIKLNLKYQVHTIALLQRLVGIKDESLIGLAREDASSMYTQIIASLGENNGQ